MSTHEWRKRTESVSFPSSRFAVSGLYVDGQISKDGVGRRYKPLEERQGQLEDSIPRLQAELDFARVNRLSEDEILSEAQTLHSRWADLDTKAKRQIVETITEKIVIGAGEIAINLCYLPTSEEMAKGGGRGGI